MSTSNAHSRPPRRRVLASGLSQLNRPRQSTRLLSLSGSWSIATKPEGSLAATLVAGLPQCWEPKEPVVSPPSNNPFYEGPSTVPAGGLRPSETKIPYSLSLPDLGASGQVLPTELRRAGISPSPLMRRNSGLMSTASLQSILSDDTPTERGSPSSSPGGSGLVLASSAEALINPESSPPALAAFQAAISAIHVGGTDADLITPVKVATDESLEGRSWTSSSDSWGADADCAASDFEATPRVRQVADFPREPRPYPLEDVLTVFNDEATPLPPNVNQQAARYDLRPRPSPDGDSTADPSDRDPLGVNQDCVELGPALIARAGFQGFNPSAPPPSFLNSLYELTSPVATSPIISKVIVVALL
ncbi:hypothetical protein CC2G_001921 [Coprinopsis cinerea AmutBmut pab1-1]|nr:hypothetical protein CC2G_001921 [Coprinopsis cinerea AmutBmut pab1-1]